VGLEESNKQKQPKGPAIHEMAGFFSPFSVIPAEVPRPARDPELVERAGIQGCQELLDPGACPGPDPGFAGVTA